MKIEDLVLTIEQAKHLQKLGLDMSDAAHFHYRVVSDLFGNDVECKWRISDHIQEAYGREIYAHIPTYTLQEILDKLPNNFEVNHVYYYLKISYESDDYYKISYCNYSGLVKETFYGDKLLDVAYETLCWLIEDGYLKDK